VVAQNRQTQEEEAARDARTDNKANG
jgi:hypothetical protein